LSYTKVIIFTVFPNPEENLKIMLPCRLRLVMVSLNLLKMIHKSRQGALLWHLD